MPDYEPTSRRPIAAALRRTASGTVRWSVRHDIDPDVVSGFSVVVSLAAGWCFARSREHPWLLVVAPAACYARLWFNMLDGMVALAARKASRRGELVNELPDRLSDLAIFVGVAHSGLCSPISGYWAAIAALLTAYVGTLGQAVGARREFGGVMSKPWRMVTLHVGAWVLLPYLVREGVSPRFATLTILDWTCVIVVVGCVQTIVVRLARIARALDAGPLDREMERDTP